MSEGSVSYPSTYSTNYDSGAFYFEGLGAKIGLPNIGDINVYKKAVQQGQNLAAKSPKGGFEGAAVATGLTSGVKSLIKGGNFPSVNTYKNLGLTGVTPSNLPFINLTLAKVLPIVNQQQQLDVNNNFYQATGLPLPKVPPVLGQVPQ